MENKNIINLSLKKRRNNNMTKTIYVIRQTQAEYYDGYAFIAYENYDKAQKHKDILNKEYGNEYEVDSDMAHFYEVDTIDLVLESEEE